MTDVIVFKSALADRTFEFDWYDAIVQVWRRDYYFALGAIVRPPVANGFLYEVTTAGRTSEIRPDFEVGAGETTTDGSVVYTARHPDTPSIEAISDSVFTPDDGITVPSKSIDGFKTIFTVSGGVAGEKYRVINTITKTGGGDDVQSVVVEIENPADV